MTLGFIVALNDESPTNFWPDYREPGYLPRSRDFAAFSASLYDHTPINSRNSQTLLSLFPAATVDLHHAPKSKHTQPLSPRSFPNLNILVFARRFTANLKLQPENYGNF